MVSIDSILSFLKAAASSYIAESLIEKLLAGRTDHRYEKWAIFQVESLKVSYRLLKVESNKLRASDKQGTEFFAPLSHIVPEKLLITFRREDGTEAIYSPIQAQIVLLLNESLFNGFREAWTRQKQWVYNHRKLRTPLQYDLLKAIVEISLDDPSVRFTPHAIANALLGPRLSQHPERARVYSGVEYHFRALAAAKAIDQEIKDGGALGFKIGETAIAELEKQNLSRTLEKREQINKYLIVMLTVVSVVAAIGQTWVANEARAVANSALELQRAQFNLELARDQRAREETVKPAPTPPESAQSFLPYAPCSTLPAPAAARCR